MITLYPAKVVVLVTLLLLIFVSDVLAHSGRTDANGGHNCSAKSQDKGLCSGYHYHNGGTSSGSTYTTLQTSKPFYTTAPKQTPSIQPTQVPVAPVAVSMQTEYTNSDGLGIVIFGICGAFIYGIMKVIDKLRGL